MRATRTPHPIPREIRVVIAAGFVVAVGYGLISPVLPQFARSFGVSVTAASMLISAFAFFRLAFAPASGSAVARFGERRTYIAGLLIVALSTGACAFATSYGQLLVFRALGGIGSTMFTVSAMALVVRLAPPRVRGRVSSAYASAFLLGSVAGPVLGGLLAGRGLRVPFGVYALVLLVAACMVLVFLRDAPSGTPSRPGGQQAPATAHQEPMTVRCALADVAYRTSLLTAFANGWANLGVRISLVPLFAAAMLEQAPWVAGAALATFAAGNACALMFSGRLADTAGRRPVIVAGTLIGGVFTVVVGFTTALVPFLAASFVAGAGAGTAVPGLQATIGDVVGTQRSGGKVLAGFQMVQDTGAILGPVVAGVLVDVFSYQVAFTVAGLVLVLTSISWWWSRETLPIMDP